MLRHFTLEIVTRFIFKQSMTQWNLFPIKMDKSSSASLVGDLSNFDKLF